MRKVLLVLASLAMLLIASCSNDADERYLITKTFQEIIDETKSGETLDLSNLLSNVSTDKSYTISKPITIKNGSGLANATFMIRAGSVIFEGSAVGNVFVLAENVTISADESTKIKSIYCQKDTKVLGDGKIENKIYLNGNDGQDEEKKNTLQKLIDETESGETLDLSNLPSDVSTDKSYIISKPITIKNGSGLASATFVIQANSITFEGSTVGNVILANENITISALNETGVKKLYCLYGTDKATINNKNAYTEIIGTTSDGFSEGEEKEIHDSYTNFSCFPGVKIEGVKENGEYCTKITNEKAKSNKDANDIKMISEDGNVIVWKEHLTVEKSKNYEISIDLKSTEDCMVRLETGDLDNYPDSNPSKYCNLYKDRWTTCTLQTGTAPETWTQGKFLMQIGLVETLYAKNFKIKEVQNGALGINLWYDDYKDYGKISCESNNKDGLTLKIADEIESYDSAVEVILPRDFKENTLYKVSFDVEGNVNRFSASIETKKYFSDSFSSKLDGTKKIELYLPATKDSSRQNQTYIPAKLQIRASKQCTLKISNFKVEEAKMTLNIDGQDTDMDLDGDKFKYSFKKIASSSPIVITSVSFDGKSYAGKTDKELLCGDYVYLLDKSVSTSNGKTTLKVFDKFDGFYDFDFCVSYNAYYYENNYVEQVEYVKQVALQASLDNIVQYNMQGEKFYPLFIAGSMIGWQFTMLKYTGKMEGVEVPFESGIWYYEFTESDSRIAFKVCTAPNWGEGKQVFVESYVDDREFSYSSDYTFDSSNAEITCSISAGDKLCFCYDETSGKCCAKVVKASNNEVSSGGNTTNGDDTDSTGL